MSSFDKHAKDWDAKPGRIIQTEKIYKSIKQHVVLNPNMLLADIGAGTGLLLSYFAEEVKEISAYDNSQGMLQVLIENLEKKNISNVRTYLFDANTSHLPLKSFDLIISSMTFHHINRVHLFLTNVYRSLKKGGRICIADIETEDGTFHSGDSDNIPHLGFKKSYFEKMLKKANFINTKVTTIFEINKNNKKYPLFLAYGEK